jgi:hypothetical protein
VTPLYIFLFVTHFSWAFIILKCWLAFWFLLSTFNRFSLVLGNDVPWVFFFHLIYLNTYMYILFLFDLYSLYPTNCGWLMHGQGPPITASLLLTFLTESFWLIVWRRLSRVRVRRKATGKKKLSPFLSSFSRQFLYHFVPTTEKKKKKTNVK